MGGLYKIFLKLTPIMLLICCICYGIMHTFQQTGQNNITYLYKEQINIGTQEQPEYKQLYRFDVKTYAQNIDQNILKRSIEHTIELQAYQNTLDHFNELWEDGYQFLDGIKTIVNALLLTINTLILPINILLVPIRVISGLLLTGMSLIGININNGTIICPMLTFFVDKFAIPFLNPTHNEIENPSQFAGNTYQFDSTPNFNNSTAVNVEFVNQNQAYYRIEINVQSNKTTITYYGVVGTPTITAYDSSVAYGGWDWENLRTITLSENRGLTQEQQQDIVNSLNGYANNITPKADTYWQFSTNIQPTNTNGDIYFYFKSSYTSTDYAISYYGFKADTNNLWYIDIDPNTPNTWRYNLVYTNGQWTNDYYKKTHIQQQNLTNAVLNQINLLLLFNAQQIS